MARTLPVLALIAVTLAGIAVMQTSGADLRGAVRAPSCPETLTKTLPEDQRACDEVVTEPYPTADANARGRAVADAIDRATKKVLERCGEKLSFSPACKDTTGCVRESEEFDLDARTITQGTVRCDPAEPGFRCTSVRVCGTCLGRRRCMKDPELQK